MKVFAPKKEEFFKLDLCIFICVERHIFSCTFFSYLHIPLKSLEFKGACHTGSFRAAPRQERCLASVWYFFVFQPVERGVGGFGGLKATAVWPLGSATNAHRFSAS